MFSEVGRLRLILSRLIEPSHLIKGAPIPTTQPRSSDALSMDSMFGRYIGYRPVLHRSLKVLVGQPGGSGVFVQKFILIGCHRGYHKRYKSHSVVKNICELPNTNPPGYDRPILHLVADEKHPLGVCKSFPYTLHGNIRLTTILNTNRKARSCNPLLIALAMKSHPRLKVSDKVSSAFVFVFVFARASFRGWWSCCA